MSNFDRNCVSHVALELNDGFQPYIINCIIVCVLVWFGLDWLVCPSKQAWSCQDSQLTTLGGIKRSKIQLFRNMVMLHIKLKGTTHAATR